MKNGRKKLGVLLLILALLCIGYIVYYGGEQVCK